MSFGMSALPCAGAGTRAESQVGATAVEYAIMVALVAGVIITAVMMLGGQSSGGFDCVNDRMAAAGIGDTGRSGGTVDNVAKDC